MDKIVIFGTTQFSKMCHRLIEKENAGKVVAYTVDKKFLPKYDESISIEGLPVIAFEQLERIYPPTEYKILNTIGYTNMNTLRKEKYDACIKKGYEMLSFVSESSTVLTEENNIGNGNIVLPGSFVGYDVSIGNNNVIYTGCILTHDIYLGNNSFLAAGCTIGGNVTIGSNCFIGMNSTIKNRLKIDDFTLIGAGTYLSVDTEQYSVFVPERSKKLDKISTDLW